MLFVNIVVSLVSLHKHSPQTELGVWACCPTQCFILECQILATVGSKVTGRLDARLHFLWKVNELGDDDNIAMLCYLVSRCTGLEIYKNFNKKLN